MSRYNKTLKKTYFQIFIIFLTILLLACLVLLVLDINKNIGIIPLIFITLSIVSVSAFIYNIFYIPKENDYNKKSYNIKFSLILFFIINVVLSFFSIITLWI